jgi:hypothetical protein
MSRFSPLTGLHKADTDSQKRQLFPVTSVSATDFIPSEIVGQDVDGVDETC